MTEFGFYIQLHPGAKNENNGRYELKKMVLNQAQNKTKK